MIAIKLDHLAVTVRDMERSLEFYRDLLASPGSYVRSARNTLMRMLAERIIRGSTWKIPGGELAVSFTALPPPDTLPLMRWRKRYVSRPKPLLAKCTS